MQLLSPRQCAMTRPTTRAAKVTGRLCKTTAWILADLLPNSVEALRGRQLCNASSRDALTVLAFALQSDTCSSWHDGETYISRYTANILPYSKTELCQNSARNIHNSARHMPELCQHYARSMPEICQNYARNLPEIYQNSVRNIPEIFQNYARNMPETYKNYARNMPEICQTYAGIMPELC